MCIVIQRYPKRCIVWLCSSDVYFMMTKTELNSRKISPKNEVNNFGIAILLKRDPICLKHGVQIHESISIQWHSIPLHILFALTLDSIFLPRNWYYWHSLLGMFETKSIKTVWQELKNWKSKENCWIEQTSMIRGW